MSSPHGGTGSAVWDAAGSFFFYTGDEKVITVTIVINNSTIMTSQVKLEYQSLIREVLFMNVKEKEFRRRYEEMGDLLRICRNKRRMTQQQLAETAHVSITYIRNIENGSGNITIIVYFMICEVLGVEPWELIRECW